MQSVNFQINLTVFIPNTAFNYDVTFANPSLNINDKFVASGG